MIELDNSPNTRKNFIGASDAPAIMQVSPWTTPFQLWEEKCGLREPKADNFALQYGRKTEEKARQEFEKQMGLIVFPARYFHQTYPWMCATLDGIDIEKKNFVEIKCPGKLDHESAMDGVIPEKYFPQLMHQMTVLGLSRGFYFSYTEKSSKIIEINIDQKYCNKLLKKELEFWKHVQDKMPPSLTEKDYVHREDLDWYLKAQEWLDVDAKMQELQNKHETLRQELIGMASNSNSQGAGIKMSRVLRKGNIDFGSIPELINVDLEKYRKQPIESWRIAKCQ